MDSSDFGETKRALFAEAVLGEDAADFFHTELGKYIIGCAVQERHEALESLSSVPWWNSRKIRLLQNKAWRAEELVSWLNDLVVRGEAAKTILKEDDNDDTNPA